MKAVAYVLRSQIRALAVPMLLLSAVVAAVFAVVITFAAGARRTDTLAPRVDAAAGGKFDYLLTQQAGGPPLTDAVARLPGVKSADSYSYVFGGLARLGGDPVGADVYVFAGSEGAVGARVVDGRAVDPTVDDEFVASPSFVAVTGAKVGDRFELHAITQEQAQASQYGIADNGPTLDATMVGIIEAPSMVEDPTPLTMFPAKLLERSDVGYALTLIPVRVEPGTDEHALRGELATLPDGAQISVESGSLISDGMRHAIRTQARGTWLLALFAGLAAVVALAQIITRQARPTAGERHAMSAIGYTDDQVLLSAMARATPPIVIGGLAGAALAVPFSSLFPTGVVGRFEPAPGVLVQWPILIACTATLVAALLACTGIVLALTSDRVGPVVLSPAVDAIAARSPVLPAAVGMRLGFTRARRERGSMLAALAGIMLTVSGLVAAITFGVSLDRLIDEPYRYGSNVDASLGDNGGEQIEDDLAQALEADPNVESLLYYAQDFATAGDNNVEVMGMRPVRGDALPLVLAGRLPLSADEIALGRVTARDTEAEVGDALTLVGGSGTHTFRVVGIAVLTGFGSNEGVGHGAVATLDGLHQISDAGVTNAAVDFRSSVADGIAPYQKRFDSAFVGDAFVPAAISGLVRVRSIPFVLAGLLGMLAVLTITHTLVTSLRARRRDLAVVRALGAAPSFVSRAVHWQATLVTFVPAIVGVPLGLIVGRQVFVALADGIGAVDQVDYPLRLVGAVLVAVVALANVVAIWPAWKARRWRPAAALAAE